LICRAFRDDHSLRIPPIADIWTRRVSSRDVDEQVSAHAGAGFLFALASSPGVPTPGRADTGANAVTVVLIERNDMAEDSH
jgi:hypothetical protein